jgi:type VI secretion system secreted protein VgrG
VQFHWDREGKHDANSSCWIRVNMPWGGKNWGMVNIPRVGQEVIVGFEEGDMDRPIILGNVFDAYQMTAYKLPDNKTRTWIKTDTSPGGDGYNEVRFEDLSGKENVFIHAERDQDKRTQNDQKEQVGSEKHMTVGGGHSRGRAGGSNGKGNLFEKILNDKHQKVDGNQYEKVAQNKEKMIEGNQDCCTNKDKKERIKQDDHQHVDGNRKQKVDKNKDSTIGKDLKELVQGNDHMHVNKDRKAKVDGNQDLTVGKDHKETIEGEAHIKVGKDMYLTVDGKVHVQFGDEMQHTVGKDYGLGVGKEYYLCAGEKVVIECKEITLKAAGGFVKIDSGGVIIQGTKVKINSGGSPGKGKKIKTEEAKKAEEPDDAQPPEDAKEAKPTDPKPPLDEKPGPILMPDSWSDLRGLA